LQNKLALRTTSLDRREVLHDLGKQPVPLDPHQGMGKPGFSRQLVAACRAFWAAPSSARGVDGLLAAMRACVARVKTNTAFRQVRPLSFHGRRLRLAGPFHNEIK